MISYTLFNSSNQFIQPDSLIETFKILPNAYYQIKETGMKLNKLNLVDSILTFYYSAFKNFGPAQKFGHFWRKLPSILKISFFSRKLF